MKIQALLIQLQAWAQEEMGAQGALLRVLKDLEQAVLKGRAEGLEESGQALEECLGTNRQREKNRHNLMRGLAQHYGIPVGTLSLSSVIERAGAEGHATEQLAVLRDRLRERVQEVAHCSHLLTVMASHHQGVLADLMSIIGASSAEEETRRHGVLVDAEA